MGRQCRKQTQVDAEGFAVRRFNSWMASRSSSCFIHGRSHHAKAPAFEIAATKLGLETCIMVPPTIGCSSAEQISNTRLDMGRLPDGDHILLTEKKCLAAAPLLLRYPRQISKSLEHQQITVALDDLRRTNVAIRQLRKAKATPSAPCGDARQIVHASIRESWILRDRPTVDALLPAEDESRLE